MRSMIYTLVWGLLILPFNIYAQENLVPNPSFEDTLSCPTGLGMMGSTVDWISPTQGSPDFFHTCSTSGVGVPQNGFGFQEAKTGKGYVGVHTSDFTSTDYREYVQCQLISPLEEGEWYEISFYVSRTDSSKKACDNIGAFMSSTPISAPNNLNLPFTPQVVSEPNNPIVDDVNWVQIIDTIIAAGEEEYLTIGVFSDIANTNWIPVVGGWEDEAHYYIDDVLVRKVILKSIHEIPKSNISIFPNPSDGRIIISSDEAIKNYTIYSSIGQLIYKSKTSINVSPIQLNLSSLTPGIYYLIIKTSVSIYRKKIIIN